MKSFLINVFWVLGLIIGLDGAFTILTTGLYTKKDVSLIIFITLSLIIASMITAFVYYCREHTVKKSFGLRLSAIISLSAANLLQFFTILTTNDMYLIFSK